MIDGDSGESAVEKEVGDVGRDYHRVAAAGGHLPGICTSNRSLVHDTRRGYAS